jgi:CubicO group peptidase (beta-lactamase class C family)
MREAITRIVSLLVASHVSVAGARQIPLTQPSSLSANTVDDAFGSDSIGIADASFEAYIQDQMAKWHVPGFAIALIDGNKTWSNVSTVPRFCSPPV